MLRASDRRRAYDLLTRVPGVHQPGMRFALANNAGLPKHLLEMLRFHGSVADFVTDLVHRCGEQPVDGTGDQLLASVLRFAATLVGIDLKVELTELAERVTTPPGVIDPTPEDFFDELNLNTTASAANSPYLAIDRLFVPPKQYERIREVLDEHHAVFILGDPHIGKTYSAVRLLWELYRDAGMQPRWINSNRLAEALESPEGSFETRIGRLFERGTAVYLEDPFGTTVPVDMRDFVGNLKAFLRMVRTMDIRVVITSRSQVFNQVIPDLFAPHVVTLSQRLNLDRSYQPEDLTEIVQRYLVEYQVAWRSEAGPDVVSGIVRELPAPHNIARFLVDTKDIGTAVSALAELPSYRDLAEQFALMIRDMETWQQGFLCVAYFFSSDDLAFFSSDDLAFFAGDDLAGEYSRTLFEQALANGDFGSPTLASWDRAVQELGDYLTTRQLLTGVFLTLRHPSIEEAFDQRVRADPVLREVVRRLVARAAASTERRMLIAAFRCFVHYSDQYWDTSWGPGLFDRLLNGDDNRLREITRLYVIEESHRLSAGYRELLHEQAEHTWNERFLLRLLIGAPVATDRRQRLVARLKNTWDDWVRYELARNLPWILPKPEMSATHLELLADRSSTVAKAAIVSVVALILRQPNPDWDVVRMARSTVAERLKPFFDVELQRGHLQDSHEPSQS
jgi:hypothetical protein